MLVESAVLLLSFAPTPKVDERGASTGPSKTSYSSAGGSTCSDGFVDVLIGPDKKPWKDSGGDGCAAYKSNFWSCDARGYDKDGHSAKTACCHCGGGQEGGAKCTDKKDWVPNDAPRPETPAALPRSRLIPSAVETRTRLPREQPPPSWTVREDSGGANVRAFSLDT